MNEAGKYDTASRRVRKNRGSKKVWGLKQKKRGFAGGSLLNILNFLHKVGEG